MLLRLHWIEGLGLGVLESKGAEMMLEAAAASFPCETRCIHVMCILQLVSTCSAHSFVALAVRFREFEGSEFGLSSRSPGNASFQINYADKGSSRKCCRRRGR